MDDLLRRYRDGDHERVWKELSSANGRDVARETMERVRKNVELLEKRLRDSGYAFDEDICPAFAPSPLDTNDTLQRIEAAFGPLPLALRSFFEAVGGIDFRAPDGRYAGAPWRGLDMPDPLVVWPLRDSFESNYNEWEMMTREEREHHGPFRWDFAPDAYHKDNISGGPPYGIVLPNSDVDPALNDDVTGTTFLGHLRQAIRNGGFLRRDAESRLPGITKDLLTF